MPTQALSKRPRTAAQDQLAAKIWKNTVFGVVANAAQVITRLVVVPAVIAHLGLAGYGIWAIIMATAGYMRFGTAGVKSAFQKYVADATVTGDYGEANRLLSTGSISILVLSLLGSVPFVLWSEALTKAAGVPAEFISAASRSITLLAAIMVASNFGAVFEAILMGSQRLETTRKFTIIMTVGEAISIVALLHYGYGLFAMAGTIAASELVYVACCYIAARHTLPEVCIGARYLTAKVVRELLRFAGSYQLVNILEVLYGLLLPVIVLRDFGANTAGEYTLVTRLVSAALMGQDAMILPLLSGAAVVFASGITDTITSFLKKAFKTSLVITLFPLAFISAFGSLMVFAWTGETGPQIGTTMWLCCLGSFFSAISRVQLILYRAAGKALHDNLRQAFRLVTLAVLAYVAGHLTFFETLGALALAESIGVAYMFTTMTYRLRWFTLKGVLPDNWRLMTAAGITIAAGLLVMILPIPLATSPNMIARVRLAEVSVACLAAFFPAVKLTGSISPEEEHEVIRVVAPWIRFSARSKR